MSASISSEGFLTDFLSFFQTQCVAGMNNLVSEAYYLVWILGIITLCIRLITDGHIFGAGSWTAYIMVTFKVGIYLFLVQNWHEVSIDVIFKSFEIAGLEAGNIKTDSIDVSGVMMTGFRLTQNLLMSIMQTTGWQVVMGILPLLLLQTFAILAIILAFGFMAMQFFLVTVEYYVFAATAVILIPFGMIPQFKFLFDSVLSGLFKIGVKYMVVVFVTGLGQAFFSSAALAADSAPGIILQAVIGVFVYAAVIITMPSVVSGLINGSPSADSGAAGIVSTATGAAARIIRK